MHEKGRQAGRGSARVDVDLPNSPRSKHTGKDTDPCSRAFLFRIGSPETCVFGDVCDCFEGEISTITDHMPYNKKYVAIQTSNMLPTQWCYKHQRHCRVRGGLFDATGLPCVGWSTSGLRMGLDDPSMNAWLAHFHKQRLLSTPILLLENVTNCPTDLIQVNLPEHDIQRIEADPADVGWRLLRRKRSFFLATRRDMVIVKHQFADVYNEICTAFNGVKSTPRQALLASHEDASKECS